MGKDVVATEEVPAYRGLDHVADDLDDQLEAFRDQGNPVLYLQKKIDVRGRDFDAAALYADYALEKVSGG